MPKIKSSTVFEHIEEAVQHDAPPLLLHDLVAELLVGHALVADEIESFEIAESLLDEIRMLIVGKQSTAEASGITWKIELYGSCDEYIKGSSFEDPAQSHEERRIRRNRVHAAEVRRALLSLNPIEFEIACTKILKLIGCTDPKTSPRRDDGGIDFYGRLHLKGRLDSISPLGGFDAHANVWLIGQAKHYPNNPIQTAPLRELVGSIELARTRGAIHAWEGLDLRPFDATLQLIFTTGKFTTGALSLLERSGMLSMNGEQLATFLCDAAVGIDDSGKTFDLESFRTDLGIV